MPTASSTTTVERKKASLLTYSKGVDQNDSQQSGKNLLKIGPALPVSERRNLYVRSHSTLNAVSISKTQESNFNENVTIQTHTDGSVVISRTQDEKEKYPDRMSLDRRGLSSIPIISGEPRLRLLSLQHNLIIDLEMLRKQKFPTLVFLDLYNNQLENMHSLECLENLRVLLMGKNRIKKIEGLESLKRIEVLDLHGNQIGQISGLCSLSELKVLNLAGNQIGNIGVKDLCGLDSLQELNLRRNRLRKLLGFGDTPNLYKLFISNNDIQSIEDISSIAKSPNIKEISIDNNPVFLGGECVSFLVSYLPYLTKLNMMQITEQVRKAAMAWRRNKETTNAAFMDLTSETSLNCRREEVISNARTNWELLRSQTKCLCLNNNGNSVEKSIKNLKPDSDFILTSFKQANNTKNMKIKKKISPQYSNRVPLLPDKISLVKTPSQDTENSQNTSSSNNSGNEFFKLPPILIPIINKIEQKVEEPKEGGLKKSGSLSSIGPNVDSSISSLASGSDGCHSSSESISSSCHPESESDVELDIPEEEVRENIEQKLTESGQTELETKSTEVADNTSNISSATTSSNTTRPSTSSGSSNLSKVNSRCLKSAANGKPTPAKCSRVPTAKVKKQASPILPKDREQGGDYLIEISGRYLNIYGHGALRFIDKPWNASKANDVTTVKFSYINFNNIAAILNKLKHRFPNIDHFIFKETNIYCIGQLNALAEVQGLVSVYIDPEGNPIWDKKWRQYVIYRLAHWGLKILNNKEITENEIKIANEEYQSLSDLVLWSLPDVLLQPLLVRLRIDVSQSAIEQNAKNWLLAADPELKSVVCKEALQWKKGNLSQEDVTFKQKAKHHISSLLENMVNAMDKLKILDREWPTIMHEFVQNTLLDYSQLDLYMKQKLQELNK